MTSLAPIVSILHENKPYFAKKYHVSSIGVFGSVARGESRDDSDIDILVVFSEPIGFDFVTLADELETLLGHRVDLVSANAVKPAMMRSIGEDIRYA